MLTRAAWADEGSRRSAVGHKPREREAANRAPPSSTAASAATPAGRVNQVAGASASSNSSMDANGRRGGVDGLQGTATVDGTYGTIRGNPTPTAVTVWTGRPERHREW